ncbi:MAG: HlyD family efflux transporter periplasmic adaptor subunit, partial [Pseudomonadota bacterium]
SHPASRLPSAEAVAAAESAVAQRRGVVRGGSGAPDMPQDQPVAIAVPILVDDHAKGAAVLELGPVRPDALRRAMRALQWAAAWLRDAGRAEDAAEERRRFESVGHALHVVVAAAESQGFEAAARAAATDLASRFQCDRVAIGLRRGRRTRVRAISHAAQFGRRMSLVRLLAAAMDEAIDQRAVVLHPEDAAQEPLAAKAAAALARATGAEQVLTAPLYAGDRYVGAATFERPEGRPFTQADAETLEACSTVLAPILVDKRAEDRWLVPRAVDVAAAHLGRLLGPGRLARKLVVAGLLAVIAFFWVAEAPYRVSADAVVEGEVQRSVVAPFEGFLAEAPVRAGDAVAAGDVLARLDDRDLALDRLRLATERRRRVREYEQAIAARNRSEAAIKSSQIEQAEAQIELVDARIARAALRAPFDGVVVSGDLSQRIGAAVARGDVLLEVAPLDSWRVVMRVDERRIADVAPGQTGALLVAALPHTRFDIEVTAVTPVAAYADGQTTFEVEARVLGDASNLAPGMEGAGRIDVDQRRLIAIWVRPLAEWARLAAWRWAPWAF